MRSKMLVFMFFISGACCNLAFSNGTHTPEIICRTISRGPEIDGFVSEEEWMGGEPLTGFYKLGSGREAALLPNMAVVVHDKEKLYIAMIMAGDAGSAMSENLWRDGVEIFIDPLRTGDSFYQIAANPYSSWSAEYPAGGAADAGWDPGKEFFARELLAGWVLEMSIPFASLGGAPDKGDVWGINLCRNDSRGGRMTLAPLRVSFHEPERFCRVIFSGKQGALLTAGKPADSREHFRKLYGRLSEQIISMPDERFFRKQLMLYLEEFEQKTAVIEREIREHPVFADFYGEWAYASILNEFKNDVYWRFRITDIF